MSRLTMISEKTIEVYSPSDSRLVGDSVVEIKKWPKNSPELEALLEKAKCFYSYEPEIIFDNGSIDGADYEPTIERDRDWVEFHTAGEAIIFKLKMGLV